MKYGAIYIAHNPRNGGNTFKVGKTERSIDERMKELSAETSNLGTYTAPAFFVVKDIDTAEKACHKRLRQYRVQNNREFFELPFHRLLQIVEDVIEPYLARSLIPKKEEAHTVSAPERNTSEVLESLREKRKEELAERKKSLAKVKKTTLEWIDQIRQKTLKAEENLQGEDFLKWEIHSETNLRDIRKEVTLKLCSVLVACRFRKKPLTLTHNMFSALGRKKIASDDKLKQRTELIKKIEGTKLGIFAGDMAKNFCKKEDDGRIGQIGIYAFIDNYSKSQPIPTLKFEATPICYDSYKMQFGDSNLQYKYFNNPDEAF
jgi:hypothetical protein